MSKVLNLRVIVCAFTRRYIEKYLKSLKSELLVLPYVGVTTVRGLQTLISAVIEEGSPECF